MTQGATIYAFPQVQFVKHIVLTPPINLSYCHPFSSLPTKLVLLSVFASISACAFIYAFMCGVCICYVSVHVGLLVCACVCTYLHACVCVSVSVCMICLCVSVCDKHPANGSIRAFKFIRGKKGLGCTAGHSRH